MQELHLRYGYFSIASSKSVDSSTLSCSVSKVRSGSLYSILEIMSGEDFSFLTTLSSTCCVQALMWLRPGLRGVSKTTKNVVASANVRHHYLKGLEGCVSTIIDDVQASFLQLYVVWMGFVLVSLALLTYTNARTFSNTNQHSNTGTQK